MTKKQIIWKIDRNIFLDLLKRMNVVCVFWPSINNPIPLLPWKDDR